MTILHTHQLDIMLFMSGICFILALMTMIIHHIPKKKKSILILLEISSMLMLLFEREAYIHRGDVSNTGFVMVRIANGIVFFMVLFIPHLITLYLEDIFRAECGMTETPASLIICQVLFVIGTAMLVISQFTGLYYTFTDQNLYVRSPYYLLSYAAPGLIILLQEHTIVRHRKLLHRGFACTLAAIIALPAIAAVAQAFLYGVSLTSIATVLVVIVFYIFVLLNLEKKIREGREKEKAMFEETVEALANAVDAKDGYTHGHSSRVAEISGKIAKKSGLSEKECRELFFAALLHDIGKIGIPDAILNKQGKLTEEEFAQIKQHPVLGHQILSGINQFPSLSLGAHYHHERFDGKGYPDGLRGYDIPQYARIIAVADAYDAMSSNRSYRKKLTPEMIRQELIRGMGTQFDPNYAEKLLEILDEETEDGTEPGQEPGTE